MEKRNESERCLTAFELADKIRAEDKMWHLLADEKLADKVFSLIRKDYQNAQMIRTKAPYELQYIAATEEAKEKLFNSLKEKYLEYREKASCMEEALQSLIKEEEEEA